MGYPWGISGPQFLALYSIALGLVLGWAWRSRYRLRRPPAPAFDRRPELAELAFLAGGPQRVVEAAFAELIDAGRVHLARNGWLTAATGARSDDELHDAALRRISGRSGSVGWVVLDLSEGPAVAAVGDRLVEGRLLVAPAQANAVRRRTVLLLGLLGAVGIVRIFDGGLRHGHPVGYLALLVVLTGAADFVLRKREIKARTVHGDRVLAAARGAGPDADSSSVPFAAAVTGVAGAVALGGLAAFPDPAVRNALVLTAVRSPASQSGGGCGSWSYSGDGGYSSSDTSGGGSSDGGGGGSSCGGSSSSCGGSGCGWRLRGR